jgi:hypothetical protein
MLSCEYINFNSRSSNTFMDVHYLFLSLFLQEFLFSGQIYLFIYFALPFAIILLALAFFAVSAPLTLSLSRFACCFVCSLCNLFGPRTVYIRSRPSPDVRTKFFLFCIVSVSKNKETIVVFLLLLLLLLFYYVYQQQNRH